VLITGGTGALGTHLARWAGTRGADHIVLLSRTGTTADPHALDDLGTRVTRVACDVTDRDALAAVLAQYPPDAVVHTAGIGGGLSFVADTTPAYIAEVCAAKVEGAALLDELLADRPLDAFILFSSVAATWGAAGQGVYAAANAYLDALAHHRRSRGATALSLAWGGWEGQGMVEDNQAEQHLRRLAILPMPPATALAALHQATGQDHASVVIASIGWQQFAPIFTAARPSPFLSALPDTRDTAATVADHSAVSNLLTQLAPRDIPDQITALTDLVLTHAADVLGGSDGLTPSRAFRDAGFDSLTAMELRTRLATATGIPLPSTVVFDHPNATALAEHLHAQLFGSVPAADETSLRHAMVSKDVDDALASIDGMTPEALIEHVLRASTS
jgi:NAD(P)-dependent dehydrogenase (short-subunit alcohol dehydrogenase family)/acyl carrier protein